MRLAELARRSGLPVATIKYYVRLGVLPPGVAESSTWASYDESHVRRLRLVRALTDVAGMSLDDVRRVLEAVDDAETPHQARGAAQWPLSPAPPRAPSPASRRRVDELLSRHGWSVADDSPHRQMLASALDTLADLEFAATDELLDAYADACRTIAQVEVARVAEEAERLAAAERLVIGTLLYEPVLLTLRRMAHEAVSAGR